MARIMGVLSFLISVYQTIIFIRIVLSWFSGIGAGGFQNVLASIADPYLNWFRRFPLRAGFLDLSPIVALGVLALVGRIVNFLARYGIVSVGVILALTLQAVWGAASFFLGFLIVIVALRLIALLFVRNAYGPFWRAVDSISQPVLFRIGRFFFRGRIAQFWVPAALSIAILGFFYLALGWLVGVSSQALAGLPF